MCIDSVIDVVDEYPLLICPRFPNIAPKPENVVDHYGTKQRLTLMVKVAIKHEFWYSLAVQAQRRLLWLPSFAKTCVRLL